MSTNKRVNNPREKERDILMCMDSNSRHIKFRKLWTVRNSETRRTYRLDQLHRFITDWDIKTLHHILINVGVNDIDTKTGTEVFYELRDVIDLVKRKCPRIKIVLAEITPRDDARYIYVLECNKLIHELSALDMNIFVADHTNLRENSYEFLADVKHVRREKVCTFATNLKRALCAAYGKQYVGRQGFLK